MASATHPSSKEGTYGRHFTPQLSDRSSCGRGHRRHRRLGGVRAPTNERSDCGVKRAGGTGRLGQNDHRPNASMVGRCTADRRIGHREHHGNRASYRGSRKCRYGRSRSRHRPGHRLRRSREGRGRGRNAQLVRRGEYPRVRRSGQRGRHRQAEQRASPGVWRKKRHAGREGVA